MDVARKESTIHPGRPSPVRGEYGVVHAWWARRAKVTSIAPVIRTAPVRGATTTQGATTPARVSPNNGRRTDGPRGIQRSIATIAATIDQRNQMVVNVPAITGRKA